MTLECVRRTRDVISKRFCLSEMIAKHLPTVTGCRCRRAGSNGDGGPADGEDDDSKLSQAELDKVAVSPPSQLCTLNQVAMPQLRHCHVGEESFPYFLPLFWNFFGGKTVDEYLSRHCCRATTEIATVSSCRLASHGGVSFRLSLVVPDRCCVLQCDRYFPPSQHPRPPFLLVMGPLSLWHTWHVGFIQGVHGVKDKITLQFLTRTQANPQVCTRICPVLEFCGCVRHHHASRIGASTPCVRVFPFL